MGTHESGPQRRKKILTYFQLMSEYGKIISAEDIDLQLVYLLLFKFNELIKKNVKITAIDNNRKAKVQITLEMDMEHLINIKNYNEFQKSIERERELNRINQTWRLLFRNWS